MKQYGLFAECLMGENSHSSPDAKPDNHHSSGMVLEYAVHPKWAI